MKAGERFSSLFDRAEHDIEKNIRPVFGCKDIPVLNEGGVYCGIWLECGPHESLTIAEKHPDVAMMSHRIFYIHQKEDGQFPSSIGAKGPGYR